LKVLRKKEEGGEGEATSLREQQLGRRFWPGKMRYTGGTAKGNADSFFVPGVRKRRSLKKEKKPLRVLTISAP